jgi:DNA-binding SARP family transcriptional activator
MPSGGRCWRILLVLICSHAGAGRLDNVAVRVRLLGSFYVGGVPERRLGSRKGRTLLKGLALARGVPVSVDRIAEVPWGDDQPARPADQVGVLASRLRGVLGAFSSILRQKPRGGSVAVLGDSQM